MGEVFARRYELLDPIADGGMGSVWRVRDHETDTVLAAKLLRHSDAGTLLRFMREQSTRIHHPHVVTPLSWVGEDDTVLFTMPLIRGGSVATLIGDWGPLPETWVAEILDQTLDALTAVHEAGVVHRDVKPANLLLEPTARARPHVRLTDFGIAAPLDQPRLTATSTAVGTPGYMAPEQKSGDGPDPRQDLHAVATVGLEMLVGHPPPFGDDEMVDSSLADSPLVRILLRARSVDPADRPGSATEMREQLTACRTGSGWEPGEVEVLDHFAVPGGVPPVEHPTALLDRGPAPDQSETPDEPTTGESETVPPARRREPRSVDPAPAPSLLAVLGLAGLGVVLLLVAGWLLLG